MWRDKDEKERKRGSPKQLFNPLRDSDMS